jgi:hypothetical protein
VNGSTTWHQSAPWHSRTTRTRQVIDGRRRAASDARHLIAVLDIDARLHAPKVNSPFSDSIRDVYIGRSQTGNMSAMRSFSPISFDLSSAEAMMAFTRRRRQS